MATKRSATEQRLSDEDRRYLDRYGEQLSDSTRRAKWIASPDEKADRKGQTLATRSPEVIRAWAEERDARPVTTRRGDDGRPRTLRMKFTDEESDRLEEIPWDDWLSTVRDRDLVFIFQQQRRNGSQSNFFRLDSPHREDG